MPAIASHTSATTNSPWSAATNEGRIKTPVTQSVAAHFWAWRESGEWPDVKTGYKFPHHEVSTAGGPGAANMRGCASGIGVLNGARGGSNIPGSDRQGVYDHLARHMKSGGMEPAPLGMDPDDAEMWLLEIDRLLADDAQALSPAKIEVRMEGAVEDRFPLLPLGHALWAIREDVLPMLVEANRSGDLLALARTMQHASAPTPSATGGTAVIPLSGIITPKGSLLSRLFGGGSAGLEGFRKDFRGAVDSSEVGRIVLNVDSPGGLVSLVPETAAEIHAARGEKPITAVVNTMAASAAYWLASQADEIVVTPSGQAGSIGVYMVHEDWSGWNDQKGIAVTYVKAGKYKTEGNPDEPLAEEAQAHWQQDVNDLYGMFVDAVAQGRGVSTAAVRSGYGEGQTLLAQRAVQAGLADRVETLEGVLGASASTEAESEPQLSDADRSAIASVLLG